MGADEDDEQNAPTHSTEPKYVDYIKGLGLDRDSAYGKCKEYCDQMLAAFPELKLVRGHYHCAIWGKRPHWWLVSPAGEVVDPTKRQFPTNGMFEYEPWEEGRKEPTGRCPNCSEYAYDGNLCCSDACHDAYVAYCMRG